MYIVYKKNNFRIYNIRYNCTTDQCHIETKIGQKKMHGIDTYNITETKIYNKPILLNKTNLSFFKNTP